MLWGGGVGGGVASKGPLICWSVWGGGEYRYIADSMEGSNTGTGTSIPGLILE